MLYRLHVWRRVPYTLKRGCSLTTGSFLNVYRRFVSQRGLWRSDRGNNFIGTRSEKANTMAQMNNSKIRSKLLKDECDWIDFTANIPRASHSGGVRERMIRSACNTLFCTAHKSWRSLRQ
ncbi:hypothetical protein LSH36_296g04031 [Paralvinella palmiformis]|uniref:Uncharacterized protein n=1 Tax=Paralvinella palmiformis TaxID=53620 RepID=A0AAD9JHW1_9ANNE|nr:hypothetical protein LSH36_296g04031 [Paralvinella palmiformis]